MIGRMGWIADAPDFRDYECKLLRRPLAKVPTSVDLRKTYAQFGDMLVYDQGDLGSCTAQTVAAAMDIVKMHQKLDRIFPSRLYLYYKTRALEDTIAVDCGAQMRNAIKAAVKFGAPREHIWPYDVRKFRTRPTRRADVDARLNQALVYERLDRTGHQDQLIDALKQVLAQGLPVCFGFSVYDSFDRVGKTGRATLPKKTEWCEGGHAVLAIGYSDKKKALLIRNSWGPDWGNNGHFWMPYAYAANPDLACDYWVIRVME